MRIHLASTNTIFRALRWVEVGLLATIFRSYTRQTCVARLVRVAFRVAAMAASFVSRAWSLTRGPCRLCSWSRCFPPPIQWESCPPHTRSKIRMKDMNGMVFESHSNAGTRLLYRLVFSTKSRRKVLAG